MPGKMPRSDPRPSVRVIRGARSGQHLASVLQEGRENANIDAVWDSSGEISVDITIGSHEIGLGERVGAADRIQICKRQEHAAL